MISASLSMPILRMRALPSVASRTRRVISRALSTDTFFISKSSKSQPVQVSRASISQSRERVLSGIQPTGVPHIGNYFGALKQWVSLQSDEQNKDALSRLYCIVDLHAITVKSSAPLPPLQQRSLHCAAFLIACGLDSSRCTLFVQSHVPQHASLCWLLQCCAPLSWLHRMTQFKSKSESSSQGSASASTALLTYPVLQAADILLYDAALVPVGDDQLQHLELCRDVARSFNSRFIPARASSEYLRLPSAVLSGSSSSLHRIMSLDNPTAKMSKSDASPHASIFLDDSDDSIAAKIKRAVTDSTPGISFDPESRPAVSNLVSILASATDREPHDVAHSVQGQTHAQLKRQTADAVVAVVRPIREEIARLLEDRSHIQNVLNEGAERARGIAEKTLRRVDAWVQQSNS